MTMSALLEAMWRLEREKKREKKRISFFFKLGDLNFCAHVVWKILL